MKLSRDQAHALKQVYKWYKSGPVTQFVTLGGYAGTGKTTLIGIIKDTLSQEKIMKHKLKIAMCSYTGRAAQNLKNRLREQGVLKSSDTISTIHGLIYDPIESAAGVIIGWAKKAEIDADLIIIDEASMVDRDIWADLLSYNLPIVAVGDHGQLPPIKGKFNLLSEPQLRIETIFRQEKSNPIINIATQARQNGYIKPGHYSETVIKYTPQDPDFSYASTDLLENYTQDTLILCGYNNTRVKLNYHIRGALGFGIEGPQVGDRVICLRNNHKSGLYNGMLGTIQNISDEKNERYEADILMDDTHKVYSGKIYAPQFNSTEPINFTKNRAKAGDSDLFDFGYALTVHKAQGSQAKRVIVFEERFKQMSDEQWKKWLYTAVTRAQEELYVFGS